MNAEVPSKELNENSLSILDQPKSNSNEPPPGAGADPNTQNQNNEKLRNILDQLARDSTLLNHPDYISYIISLLQAGADLNIQDQNGKTLSDYLNEKLRNILDQLASNSNLLGNSNCIQHIMFLLQAGADPNTKGQDGKTLSYYLDEKLRDILGWLAIDRGILNNYIQYIMSLLQAGANPDIQNQDGKTLLHYVAERNNIDSIRYFLEVIKANPSMRDKSGKTPSVVQVIIFVMMIKMTMKKMIKKL